MSDELSHLDSQGRVHMVDVGDKAETKRVAEAEASIEMGSATRELLFGGGLPKGDALAAARVAGIMAAKRTSDLIPLCHSLALTSASIDIEQAEHGATVTARVETTGPTGVEMEAMTAASVAALTLYDMIKGVERGAVIGTVRLLYKEGGRSGQWRR